MSLETIHASAVRVGETGILILGASRSGKSALALDLIDQCQLRGVPAILVGDDRIVIEITNGQPTARHAPQLAGLIEVRGSGIHTIKYVAATALHLAVRLVEPAQSVRLPDAELQQILPGVFLPLLSLPLGQPAVRAVLAHLGYYGGVKRLLK